jgi:hypothetical protein
MNLFTFLDCVLRVRSRRKREFSSSFIGAGSDQVLQPHIGTRCKPFMISVLSRTPTPLEIDTAINEAQYHIRIHNRKRCRPMEIERNWNCKEDEQRDCVWMSSAEDISSRTSLGVIFPFSRPHAISSIHRQSSCTSTNVAR